MILIIRVAILTIIFAGCDGGGLYEGSSIFPKNAVMAQATIENAKQIQSIVSQDHEERYDTRIEVQRSNREHIGLMMKEVNDIAQENIHLETYALPLLENSRDKCYNGGYRNIKTYGGEISGITTEIYFENCENKSSGKKINGKISIEYYGAEPKLKGLKYTDTIFLSDVSISKDGITRKILKGSSTKTEMVALNLQGKRFWGKKMTINSIVEIDNIKTAQENAHYNIFLFYVKSISMTKGRIYINNLASYVDYDTNGNSFSIDFSNLTLAKKENIYSTANGGKIKFTIENRKSIIHIDNDGDGVYELNSSSVK